MNPVNKILGQYNDPSKNFKRPPRYQMSKYYNSGDYLKKHANYHRHHKGFEVIISPVQDLNGKCFWHITVSNLKGEQVYSYKSNYNCSRQSLDYEWNNLRTMIDNNIDLKIW